MNKWMHAAIPAALAVCTATSAFAIVIDDGLVLSTPTYTVLAPGSIVEGKSIAAWSAEWWKWAWNSPAGADPLSDTTGALANQDNDRPVFFVASSNYNGALLNRSFDVPPPPIRQRRTVRATRP